MTQAKHFMEMVWEHGDGRSWDDATTCAAIMGARPTGDAEGDDGDDMIEWLFPDGSMTHIQRNGNGFRGA